MSHPGPPNYPEYFPIQFLLPQQHTLPTNVPSQQYPQQQLQLQPRSVQPSPQPIEQDASRLHTPIQAPPPQVAFPPPPFDWLLSTLTGMLHAQHSAMFEKLNETTNQQQILIAKIEALEKANGGLQETMNAVLADIQGVSTKVARLGADMSSRDATLAERLNALDDAVDTLIAEGKLANVSASNPHTELQTPPASDIHSVPVIEPSKPQIQTQSQGSDSTPQEGTLPEEEPVAEEDYVPEKHPIPGENYIPQEHFIPEEYPIPEEASIPVHPVVLEHIESGPATQPGLDGSSSALSPVSHQSPVHAPPVSQDNTPEPPSLSAEVGQSTPKTPAKTQKRAATSQTQPTTNRRSSRPSKKRQRHDGTVDQPISSKKAKRDNRVPNKTPKKQATREHSTTSFDWASVPMLDDERMDQLIYCDKCDHPYHLGCVNIMEGDPILQADIWVCPPCVSNDTLDVPVGQRSRVSDNETCRPDCPGADTAEEVFAIDAIIGRYPHSVDPTGNTMQYLIKWEGYMVARATWTPENEIGQGASALISAFEDVAKSEGLPIDDRSELILLAEARQAGWDYNVFPSW